jgi:hypothetical protein
LTLGSKTKTTYVLAPKLKKNCRKAKHTINAGLLSMWNCPARIPTE